MNIMKRFLCALMAMLSLQMAALSADRGQMPEDEPQSGFADISLAHEEHWGPNEDRGMLLTAGQWADMLCRSVEEQVFIVVCLVHKEPVHAELFKSYHIILAAFRLQLFQSGLQGFLGPF